MALLLKTITYIQCVASKSVLVVNYLHLPLYSFKRVGEGLGHSCCQTTINEILERSETKRRLLPELVQVHVNGIAPDRKGKSTCRQKKCTSSYT